MGAVRLIFSAGLATDGFLQPGQVLLGMLILRLDGSHAPSLSPRVDDADDDRLDHHDQAGHPQHRPLRARQVRGFRPRASCDSHHFGKRQHQQDNDHLRQHQRRAHQQGDDGEHEPHANPRAFQPASPVGCGCERVGGGRGRARGSLHRLQR